MNKKYFAAALAALILTACGNEKIENEETDLIETSVQSELISIVTEITETSAVTDETAEQVSVTEHNDENEVQASVAATEVTEDGKAFSSYIDLSLFADEGYYIGSYAVFEGDSLLVNFNYDPNRGDEIKPSYLLGISLTDKKQLFRIDVPSSDCCIELIENITDGNKTACASVEKIGGEKVSLIELDEDGNYKNTEGMGADDIIYSWGDKAVKANNGSIINAIDGSVLCQRIDEENDIDFVKSKIYRFSMPFDNNRFIYQIIGYEWTEGVGIYDFETSTAEVLPDSRDTSLLGVHNGMVYTVDSFDGVGENVYIYDAGTLEKKNFCGSPYELQMNDMLYYGMPSSGEFITAQYEPWFEREEEAKLAILSPDTGEILTEYTLPDVNTYYPAFFTDNFICYFDHYSSFLYTMPMPKGNFSILDKGDTKELCYTYLGNTEILKAYDNSITWNPSKYSLREFSDVMGFDGVLYTETYGGSWSQYYYLSVINKKPVCIAEGFGFGNDILEDIDGDGINELFCNCVYGADGAQECKIFKRYGDEVHTASCNELIPEEIQKEQTKANDLSTAYVPEINKIVCRYYHNGEYTANEYGEDDISGLPFTEFKSSLFASLT